jgi:hypothetical protein
MRKITFLMLSLLCASTLSAQTPEQKEELQGNASPAVSALRLASDLVKYGYSQQSAMPLINALQIISENPTQPLKTEVERDVEVIEDASKSGKVTLDFDTILADAKDFADGNETLLSLLAQIEADNQGSHRGAVNGPSKTYETVRAGDTDIYRISFVAGYLAEILVSGDGDTDLDLYVYDSNGNLIESDTDYIDDCYVRWVPRWTGSFIVKIVNRGRVYNRYVMLTN